GYLGAVLEASSWIAVACDGQRRVDQLPRGRLPVARGAMGDEGEDVVAARARHPRRREDAVSQVVEEPLARSGLHRAAEQVVGEAAVMRAGAGLEEQGIVLEELQRLGQAPVVARAEELLLRPLAHARLVTEQLPAGDRPRLLGIAGHVALDGRVEVELALGRE